MLTRVPSVAAEDNKLHNDGRAAIAMRAFKSCAAIPIKDGEIVIGVLTVYSANPLETQTPNCLALCDPEVLSYAQQAGGNAIQLHHTRVAFRKANEEVFGPENELSLEDFSVHNAAALAREKSAEGATAAQGVLAYYYEYAVVVSRMWYLAISGGATCDPRGKACVWCFVLLQVRALGRSERCSQGPRLMCGVWGLGLWSWVEILCRLCTHALAHADAHTRARTCIYVYMHTHQ